MIENIYCSTANKLVIENTYYRYNIGNTLNLRKPWMHSVLLIAVKNLNWITLSCTSCETSYLYFYTSTGYSTVEHVAIGIFLTQSRTHMFFQHMLLMNPQLFLMFNCPNTHFQQWLCLFILISMTKMNKNHTFFLTIVYSWNKFLFETVTCI